MAYANFSLIEGKQVPKLFERELKIIMTPETKKSAEEKK